MNSRGGLSIKLLAAAAIALVITIYLVSTVFSPGGRSITVATTTSLYATGLLDLAVEMFNEEYPDILVKVVAQGTGAALKTAEAGDADVVFVHAPNLEKKYINMGVLINGSMIMFNYFVIVGPMDDPAGVRDSSSTLDAFRRIMEAGSRGLIKFISRGDNSGTHNRELLIWSKLNVDPSGDWYVESGQGMSKTLIMAEEIDAYTLSDIGTFHFLKIRGRLPELDILFTESYELINIYSIYLVNREGVKDEARLFYRFVIDNIERIVSRLNDDVGAELFQVIDELPNPKYLWDTLATGDLPA